MARDRWAVYGVPAFAGAVTAAVLLGPGRERPVTAARVRGTPVAGSERLALRVQTVTHYKGHYRARPMAISLSVDGHEERWQGRTGDHGFAEARLRLAEPLGSAFAVQVFEGERVIAEGRVDAARPLEHVAVRPQAIDAVPGLSIHALRPWMVPPFPERVTVAYEPPAADSVMPRLSFAAEGAEVELLRTEDPGGCERPPCGQRWQLELRPRAPSASLVVAIAGEGETRTVRHDLPIAQGALWLDPDAVARGAIRLRAASPREEAYVSLLGRHGRIGGAVVRMDSDERGFATGHATLPELGEEPVTVIASSDPAEPPDGSVAWPLRGGAMVEPRPLSLLLDGMPQAIAGEQNRQAAVRRPAYGIVLAAGLFELLFLWRKNRLARAALARQLRRGGGDAERIDAIAGTLPLWWLILLAGGLVLAFAILAAVAAWA